MANGESVLCRALLAAADRWYAVPGYPVTGIAEGTGAELAVSEKVALEYALGDSLAGRRAGVILKNVGLNTCADPLVNATTQGLCKGVVVVAGDDILVRGSQNAQDSRYYGELAQIPVLEPDGETIGPAVEEAFAASEMFSRIALVRVTPPVLEAEAAGRILPRGQGSGRLADPDLTMRGRAEAADAVTARMFSWSVSSLLNRQGPAPVGVGPAEGGGRAVTVYPPPMPPAECADTREYGRPFVREHRFVQPPEYPVHPDTKSGRGFARTFCPSCPFRATVSMLADREMTVICDIGCSLLASNPPYSIGIASYGLGSSVAVAARSTRVALSGDYAMLHSGMNALADVCEKGLPLLCIVLKNTRMGMTGGHPAPDVARYIAWANPLTIPADRHAEIAEALVIPDEPVTLIIEGTCPEGENHGTVEC
ncbi:MAG: indolepyruvate ferredoxin oxidoreductase [Methanomicrobiaceae archaeon]|nr:indolepyruvate ferredoxin oxidoreductase [Methanomicrobiaceae archaeon]